MHEAGITRRLLEVVLERAAAAGAENITAVHLEIGEEAEASPVAIDFYWPEISRGSAAEGAQLFFQPVFDDPWACRVTAIDVDDTGRREPPDRPPASQGRDRQGSQPRR